MCVSFCVKDRKKDGSALQEDETRNRLLKYEKLISAKNKKLYVSKRARNKIKGKFK